MGLTMTPYGNLAIHDTGAPTGKTTYPTLVMLHGFIWHSEIFSRVAAKANESGVRVVLVNRRGYPGTAPFTEEEKVQHAALQERTPEGGKATRDFFRDRAREILEILEKFIVEEKIAKEGGVILSAWSLGTLTLNAFLTYAPTLPVGKVDVVSYIKFAIPYDAPYTAQGVPTPERIYSPVADPDIKDEDKIQAFGVWVSGFFTHGDTPAEYELKTPAADPPPTVFTLTPEQVGSMVHPPAGAPDASEVISYRAAEHWGLLNELRRSALIPANSDDEWAKLALRHVWCDRTIYEVLANRDHVLKELEEAKKEGKYTRPVDFVRVRGANHFLHWHAPEVAIEVFFAEKSSDASVPSAA